MNLTSRGKFLLAVLWLPVAIAGMLALPLLVGALSTGAIALFN